MKQVVFRNYILILMVMMVAVATTAHSSEIYKVVDEAGNITFTDKKPAGDSKPIKLAPLSVIETPDYSQPEKTTEEVKEKTLRQLRREYSDFAIVAPVAEESIWHPDRPVAVVWNASSQLEPGMKVTIFVDGKSYTETTSRSTGIPQFERGEHTVEAQLTDEKNRVIATATPVKFYVRRPGLNNARARPAPRGR